MDEWKRQVCMLRRMEANIVAKRGSKLFKNESNKTQRQIIAKKNVAYAF